MVAQSASMEAAACLQQALSRPFCWRMLNWACPILVFEWGHCGIVSWVRTTTGRCNEAYEREYLGSGAIHNGESMTDVSTAG